MYTYNLFFGVFVGAEQVNSLHVTEVDIVTKEKYKQ